MRLLANENFPAAAVNALREKGHDVTWIRTEAPGINDKSVLARAQRESRILITFDKDFGELAFRSLLPAASGVILFRLCQSMARDTFTCLFISSDCCLLFASHG